jgi:hypothetical protein
MHNTYRLLRGYSLDPAFSTMLATAGINEITYRVRWEPSLKSGPVGDYFEVIDYDPASKCFYDPVDLNDDTILALNGLDPSEGNPAFHQQFVYTMAMITLGHFEQSLGRKINWSSRAYDPKRSNSKDPLTDYVEKLRIYPHAFRDANAYYDPNKKAILFGYFEAAAAPQGVNFPGGVIFTCLSPDIIAHEVTHALLDSIHPRFIENTNPDVPAFHEGFADIVALLQRFTITGLVDHQIAKTRGNLEEYSLLGELATQFGNALQGNRGALRGAIGKFVNGEWRRYAPNPNDYNTIFEPHARGAILVAAIFESFIRLYNATTADLLRIATGGTGVLQQGAIHPDLVKRLSATACEIAERLLHICIRALDYCPPHDITFGDYLRALITADLDSSPTDQNGYRLALIEAFRSWGIFPDRVNTLSVESLQWAKADIFTARERKVLKYIGTFLKDKVKEIVDISNAEANNRKEIYILSNKAQSLFHSLLLDNNAEQFPEKVWASFLRKLGLTNKVQVFHYGDEEITTEKVPLIEIHKIRPAYRIGREGKFTEQVVVTLTQTFKIKNGALEGATFRGGATLILNMSRDYKVEYIIYKNLISKHRFTKQMDYQQGKTAAYVAIDDSFYADDNAFQPLNFAQLHFH